eukprot:m.91585 g.91585  ORF g.91585 m.91585 type:complete len:257 (-) comp16499_c0_seq1:350-1120(-)
MEAALLQFAAKAEMLKHAIILRDASISKPTHHEALVGMSDEIDALEDSLAQVKTYLDQEESQLVPAQNILTLLAHQRQEIDYVQSNIPNQMSPPPEAPTEKEPRAAGQESRTAVAERSEGKSTRVVKKPKTPRAEKLAYVKVDEFNSTPKYIRGRVSRDQVNKIVDVIFEVTTAKQKVLATPRRKLSDVDLTRWTNYQEAENAETKGTIFFTEADVKDLTPHRIDSAGRTCLAILRHLGRVREIRGGGLTRIVVLQ